jgi:hypothetical protein
MPGFYIFYVIAAFIVILFVGSVMLGKKKQRRKAGFSARFAVKGIAVNINGKAAVHTKQAGVYYVCGMDAWDINWEGQEVTAIGDLKGEGPDPEKYIGNAVVQMFSDTEL